MVQVMSREQQIESAFGVNHCIHFPPLAQARHRHVLYNSLRWHTYDPHRRLKRVLRMMVETHLSQSFGMLTQDFPLTDSCVSVDVTFLISRPDSHFVGPNRSLGIHPRYERSMPTVQGDIDNYMKFFLDAIDGIFFSNDRDVVTISASKLYTTEQRGRIIFNIRHRDMNIVNLIN
jgi:Holliday junction resolvase RusA-like endonuclease